MPPVTKSVGSFVAALVVCGSAAMAGGGGGPAGPASYTLRAVARTGGLDRAYGVPPDSTITNSTPGLSRAGAVVVRYTDTTRHADGIVCARPGADQAEVIVSMPRPDRLGLQGVIGQSVGLSGSTMALTRLDDPGLVEVRSLEGVLLATRRFGFEGRFSRVSLAGNGARLAVSSGAGVTGQIGVTSLADIGGEVIVTSTLAAAGDGPWYLVGPGTVDSRGNVTAQVQTWEGDALVRVSPTGEVREITSVARDPSIVAIGALTGASEREVVATVLESRGVWSLRRYDASGGFATVVSGGDVVGGLEIVGESLRRRTPAISAAGEVVFLAADGMGTGVYRWNGGGASRVMGYDQDVSTRDGLVRTGLGDGGSRQVAISDAAVNEYGQIVVVARLRDGTTALVLATPVGAPACAVDVDHDGRVTADDLGDFITLFFATQAGGGEGNEVAADFNRDGRVDADDLGDFIAGYFAADCGL